MSSRSYFVQLSGTQAFQNLHHLELCTIQTDFDNLGKILEPCKSTLRSLTLSHITFAVWENFPKLLNLLVDELNLTECAFRGLCVATSGLHFGRVNEQRPQALDIGAD
jgi:hypothetical protein